jgi:hypothetical protein
VTRHRLLELGAGPANEPCAQLGRTPDFERVNRHELRAFQAAVIAVNGPPPAPLEFAAIANAHDFGTYRTLWIVSLVAVLPPSARRWLNGLDVPSSWISAGFPPPVTYAGSGFPMRAPFCRGDRWRVPDHAAARRRQHLSARKRGPPPQS